MSDPQTHSLPQGAMAALATPLLAGGDLDEDGLQRLVQRILDGGARGVCPVGSTGEGPRFTIEQRVRIVAAVRALVPPDRYLVPALGMTTVAAAHHELQLLADISVSAVLVPAPSYYPLAPGEALDFYTDLAESSPVPLVIYNIPSYTKASIAAETVGRLARHERVVGIKDSSRDMEYLGQVLMALDDAADFRVYTGTDSLLLPSLVMGADGAIGASVNVAPELAVGICQAVDEGDLSRARELQRRLTRLVLACRRGPSPSGWKAALAGLDVCQPLLAPPARPLPDAIRAELADDLRSLGLLQPAH